MIKSTIKIQLKYNQGTVEAISKYSRSKVKVRLDMVEVTTAEIW